MKYLAISRPATKKSTVEATNWDFPNFSTLRVGVPG
jgi:hypothetical protein